jgi:hypothetical protein
MNKALTTLVAAASIAGAMAVTASPANAQWGGDWHVGGDYYYPSAYGYGYGAVPPAPVYGYGYGYGAVAAAPSTTIVIVPTAPTVAVPAVPSYGYTSAGYWPYRNLYSYAPGYYRRWDWQ